MSGRAVFWRWLTERRLVWPLAFLAAGGLLLAAFWALRENTAAME